jgi:ABC-2 type transport system ATP-binding protein
LLGPNGAGKTTTVEILEGLLRPDAGRVEILGQSWEAGGRTLRARVGIQLQETQFSDKLEVLETVRLFRSFYPRGLDPLAAVEQVGLEDKARSWVRKLSGGQRQRLSLACALVADPDLLFLDEPTTGLDPQSRLEIWGIVGAFRQRGGTVLLTTHYMEEAERLCDRVAIVDRGRIIAEGAPRELIATLEAEHVVEFVADRPPDQRALAALSGVHRVGMDQQVCRLTVDAVHRAIPSLLDELRRQGVTLHRLTTHHATLEDVFMARTGRHLRDV